MKNQTIMMRFVSKVLVFVLMVKTVVAITVRYLTSVELPILSETQLPDFENTMAFSNRSTIFELSLTLISENSRWETSLQVLPTPVSEVPEPTDSEEVPVPLKRTHWRKELKKVGQEESVEKPALPPKPTSKFKNYQNWITSPHFKKEVPEKPDRRFKKFVSGSPQEESSRALKDSETLWQKLKASIEREEEDVQDKIFSSTRSMSIIQPQKDEKFMVHHHRAPLTSSRISKMVNSSSIFSSSNIDDTDSVYYGTTDDEYYDTKKSHFSSDEGDSSRVKRPHRQRKLKSIEETSKINVEPHPDALTMEIFGMIKIIGESDTSGPQTAFFSTGSLNDETFAVGVADGLIDSERTVSDTPQMHEELCRVAEGLFGNSRAEFYAPTLLDSAYRKILERQEATVGCAAAAFGVISKEGEVSISVMGESGATLYRNGKVHFKTSPKSHPSGESYSMLVRAGLRVAGDRVMKHTFDMFTDKLSYTGKLQRGDLLVFYLGDIKKNTRHNDFIELTETYPRDGAQQLAEKVLEKVAVKIRNKQCKSDDLYSNMCLPQLNRKNRGFPTDVSLVVVKVV